MVNAPLSVKVVVIGTPSSHTMSTGKTVRNKWVQAARDDHPQAELVFDQEYADTATMVAATS